MVENSTLKDQQAEAVNWKEALQIRMHIEIQLTEPPWST